MIDFRAFRPATVGTFAQNWRNRTWGELRRVLEFYRLGEYETMAWHIGRADAGISVLYDTNHPDAYAAICRLRQIKDITARRPALDADTEPELAVAIHSFLVEHNSSRCLDDETDRAAVATSLAKALLTGLTGSNPA